MAICKTIMTRSSKMLLSQGPIIAELLQIYSDTRDLKDHEILHSNSNHLKAYFERLDYLAAQDVKDHLVRDILGKPGYESVLKAIVRFRNVYSLRLELENANAILANGDSWGVLKKFTHYSNYTQLARTEYQGSELKPGDTVAFIGSGPLPLSLILLCHQHGLRGIGLEQESDRAELSRKVLAKLDLSEQIEIIDGNHFRLPSNNGCKLIMVAAAAEPKTEIFEFLAKVLPSGTKISYRLYEKGLRRILEASSSLKLPEQFHEHLRIRPAPPVNNTVVFLTKQVC